MTSMIGIIFFLILYFLHCFNMVTIDLIYDREDLGDMISRGIATSDYIDAKAKGLIVFLIMFMLIIVTL